MLGTIPVAGSIAVEVFSAVFEEPVNRRRQEWMEQVADALRRLHQDRGIPLADLQANETFVDTVLQATHIAMRSHQEVKRSALRNAILNAGAPAPIAADRQAYFIRLVDEFSPSHLQVLKLFDNPQGWFKENQKVWPDLHSASRSAILQAVYPDLGRDTAYCTQIVKDLYDRGMMSVISIATMVTAHGLGDSMTTPLGREFIADISAPPEPGK